MPCLWIFFQLMGRIVGIRPIYKINRKGLILEYYVIYDKNDNLIAYCEDIEELSKFVNRRKKELKYRFKNKNLFTEKLIFV